MTSGGSRGTPAGRPRRPSMSRYEPDPARRDRLRRPCRAALDGRAARLIHPYWHELIRSAHLGVGHRLYPDSEPMSARPRARAAGSFPPHTYQELRAQLLEPHAPRAVILTCVATFQGSRNPYFEAAMTTAVNNWLADEFLDRDDRLRGSIVVPVFHPEAAADEIDRLGPDRRFAQVLLPVRSETPWGNVRYRPIHEAASRNRLPIMLHAWGGWGMAPRRPGRRPPTTRTTCTTRRSSRLIRCSACRRGRLRPLPGAAGRAGRARLRLAPLAAVALRQGLEGAVAGDPVGARQAVRLRAQAHPGDDQPDADPRPGARGRGRAAHPDARRRAHADVLEWLSARSRSGTRSKPCLACLSDEDREAVLRGNAAGFFGIGVAAAS